MTSKQSVPDVTFAYRSLLVQMLRDLQGRIYGPDGLRERLGEEFGGGIADDYAAVMDKLRKARLELRDMLDAIDNL